MRLSRDSNSTCPIDGLSTIGDDFPTATRCGRQWSSEHPWLIIAKAVAWSTKPARIQVWQLFIRASDVVDLL